MGIGLQGEVIKGISPETPHRWRHCHIDCKNLERCPSESDTSRNLSSEINHRNKQWLYRCACNARASGDDVAVSASLASSASATFANALDASPCAMISTATPRRSMVEHAANVACISVCRRTLSSRHDASVICTTHMSDGHC